MKPPATIKVGPYVYDIEVGGARYEAHVHELANGDGGTLFGYTNRIHLYIIINPDVPEQMQRTTLLHEVMHAAWGIQDDHPKMTEELAIQRIADPLMLVLLDNPEFVKYLVAK